MVYDSKDAADDVLGLLVTDVKKKANSYPYIVIKTEKTEDVVVFD